MTATPLSLHLFYLTFDGARTLYTGVGTLCQYFLASVQQIRRQLAQHKIDLDVDLLYAEPPADRFSYSARIDRRTRMLAKEQHVHLEALAHGVRVPDPFGTPQSWPTLCAHAVRLIRSRLAPGSIGLVLAQDTPFAGVCPELAASSRPIYTVWVAQSTAKVWAGPEVASQDPERLAWEGLAFGAARGSGAIRLGATSKYMRRHLLQEWGAAPESMLDFSNGVSAEYLLRFDRKDQRNVHRWLCRLGIPQDRPLFLSFGRAAWYKGLDISCRVGQALASECLAYPVIFASHFGPPHSSATLAALRQEYGGNQAGLLMTAYPFGLPRLLLQAADTAVVAVLSRREPFGLIPSEFRVLAPRSAALVVSDVGGLSEQISDGRDGFLVDPDDVAGIIDRCRFLLNSTATDRATIWDAGRERVERDYGLATNTAKSILEALRHWGFAV